MTQEYPVYGDRLITVETSSGDIVVEGRDVQSIVVPDGQDIRVKDNDSTLSIKASRGGSRDLHVIVPVQCSLLMRTASGDITVSDVGGQISAKSMSGQISGHRVRGRLEASSMSGDIVVLASALTSLDLDSVSGDGLAETALDQEGRYTLAAVSGNLTMRIPENQGCVLDSRSVSGSLKVKLPYEGEPNWRRRSKLVVNGGGPEVKMRTTSGNMRLRAAEDLPDVEPDPLATKEDISPFADPEVGLAPEGISPFAELEPSEDGPRETHRLDPIEEEPFGMAAEPVTSESPAERRMAILKQIEKGDMTVSEGLAKLRALD